MDIIKSIKDLYKSQPQWAFWLQTILGIKTVFDIVATWLPPLGNFVREIAMNTWIASIAINPLLWITLLFLSIVLGLGIAYSKQTSRSIKKVDRTPYCYDQYVGVEVANNGDKPIRCYAYLTQLIHLYTPTDHIPKLKSVNPNKSKLSWSGGTQDGIKDIEAEDRAIINILAGSTGDILFTFQDGNKQDHGLDWYVEVEVHGYVGERYFKLKPLSGFIRRRTENLLGIQASVQKDNLWIFVEGKIDDQQATQ